MGAVWLAWGTPEQKIPGYGRGSPTETWVYLRYKHLLATADRPVLGHSTGHTSPQSSPTRPKESLSPTAELFSSAIYRRHLLYSR